MIKVEFFNESLLLRNSHFWGEYRLCIGIRAIMWCWVIENWSTLVWAHKLRVSVLNTLGNEPSPVRVIQRVWNNIWFIASTKVSSSRRDHRTSEIIYLQSFNIGFHLGSILQIRRIIFKGFDTTFKKPYICTCWFWEGRTSSAGRTTIKEACSWPWSNRLSFWQVVSIKLGA